MPRSFTFVLLLVVCFAMLAAPILAQDASLASLSERGPFQVSSHTFQWVDESRGNREVSATVWYPAIAPSEMATQVLRAEMSHIPVVDLPPDPSGGPYPLVFYSHGRRSENTKFSGAAIPIGSSTEFREVLEPVVTHGVVVVNVNHNNSISIQTFLDRPLDILFALNQLAAINEDPESAFPGLFNTDQVAVVSFEEGAASTLALAGARMDPAVAQPYVTTMAGFYASSNDHQFTDWNWETLAAYKDEVLPGEDGQLWPALADPRIRAVAVFEPCNVELWGEQGLASATVPALVIGGSEDHMMGCEYDHAVTAYTQLGSPERTLLTFAGGSHHIPTGRDIPAEAVQELLTAWLGYYVQGRTDYADYLSEDSVTSLRNVIWGAAEDSVADMDLTKVDFIPAGTLVPGEPVQGEIAQAGERVGFSLTLDVDSRLTLLATGTGQAAENTLIDPVVFVLDEGGIILFWNDELNTEDSVADAGVLGLELPAGDYVILVGSLSDEIGPFELRVEPAR